MQEIQLHSEHVTLPQFSNCYIYGHNIKDNLLQRIGDFEANDLNPDSKFIQVEVSFYDEETTPQHSADVRVFLKKEKTKTIEEIKREAIQEALNFLKSVLADRIA